MSITRTQLNTGNNTANASAYDTTVAITPNANQFVAVFLRGHRTTSGAVTCTVTSNAGLNLTFSLIKQVDFNTIATPTDDVYIFGALTGASPGSGTLHFAFSIAESGVIWEIIELDSVNISGGTVASCVQQTGSGSSDTAGTTMTDTFGVAINSSNAVIACGGINNKNAPTATWNNGFTEGIDVGSGESTAYDLTTGFVLSGFSGTSHTVTMTSGIWGIAGAEIKAAPSAIAEEEFASPQAIYDDGMRVTVYG